MEDEPKTKKIGIETVDLDRDGWPMARAPRQYPTTKFCRRCKESKPYAGFMSRRHKICTECHRYNVEMMMRLSATHGLTVTREGMRDYNTIRNRAKMPVGPPPPGRILSEVKLCRRCHQVKPASDYASWRFRICRECDVPPVEIRIRSKPLPE